MGDKGILRHSDFVGRIDPFPRDKPVEYKRDEYKSDYTADVSREEIIAQVRLEEKANKANLAYPQRLDDMDVVRKLSEGMAQIIEIEQKCLDILNTLDLTPGNTDGGYLRQKDNLILALGSMESVSRTYERLQNISKSMTDQREAVTRFTYEMYTKPMLSKLVQQEVPGIIRDLGIEDTPEVRKVFLEHIRSAFERAT